MGVVLVTDSEVGVAISNHYNYYNKHHSIFILQCSEPLS